MKLTREDIESVAYLSRLKLSEEEIDKLTGQINRLLGNFEKLQEINTDDVEPTSHVIPVSNVFRKDVSRPSLSVEEVVSNGPQIADNCFVVPRVVET
ncbi:MAG: asparaginyl/glutamyl-tRNA amidotransferase subunit C [Armatimonadetes bacterium RBG_16_58_9]|nr:MAG: asparaginyl/glutamyl-tRNA amidotransferase subunit C [Armatimonadetes bacterium RBG_16_58_9]